MLSESGVIGSRKGKPFRTVLAVQAGWTIVAALIGAGLAGRHGALSAALGSAVAMSGCLAFAWLAGRNRALTADGILLTALKAEAVKVLVLFGLLALVLAAYKGVVVIALIASFIVAIMIFGLAFFVRDA